MPKPGFWPFKTASDKILVALLKEAGGHGVEASFSEQDVIKLAFDAFPAAFAMPGFPEHPDSKRTGVLLCRSAMIRRQGWLVKVGTRYRLTEEGIAWASAAMLKPDDQVLVESKFRRRGVRRYRVAG